MVYFSYNYPCIGHIICESANLLNFHMGHNGKEAGYKTVTGVLNSLFCCFA